MYESEPASSRFDELVDHFALDGITLTEPATGKIFRISAMGEAILSSREDIRVQCVTSQKVNFNLYLGPSDNLLCSIEQIQPDVMREGFFFDGKTEEQSFRIIEDLIHLFSHGAEKGLAFGFVADRYAELHKDFHWDDFFIGNGTPPEWPIVIGCFDSFSKVSTIPNDIYARSRVAPNCNLFRRKESR